MLACIVYFGGMSDWNFQDSNNNKKLKGSCADSSYGSPTTRESLSPVRTRKSECCPASPSSPLSLWGVFTGQASYSGADFGQIAEEEAQFQPAMIE